MFYSITVPTEVSRRDPRTEYEEFGWWHGMGSAADIDKGGNKCGMSDGGNSCRDLPADQLMRCGLATADWLTQLQLCINHQTGHQLPTGSPLLIRIVYDLFDWAGFFPIGHIPRNLCKSLFCFFLYLKLWCEDNQLLARTVCLWKNTFFFKLVIVHWCWWYG